MIWDAGKHTSRNTAICRKTSQLHYRLASHCESALYVCGVDYVESSTIFSVHFLEGARLKHLLGVASSAFVV